MHLYSILDRLGLAEIIGPTCYALLIFTLTQQASCFNFINSGIIHSHAEFEPWLDQANGTSSLSFRFKTDKRNGLLVQASDEEVTSANMFRLTLTSGRLKVEFKMGGEDFLSVKDTELGSQLHDMNWHEVIIVRRYREVKVRLDEDLQATLVSEGEKSQLVLNGKLLVGGDPENYIEGFTGCVENLEYPLGRKAKHPRLYGNVSKNCKDECSPSQKRNAQCRNGGKCLLSFDTRYISCDCIGTGFRGKKCEIEERSVYMDTPTIISQQLESLTSYSVNRFHLRFRTASHSGVLLYIGDEMKYALVEMYKGYLIVRMDLGTGSARVITGEGALDDGRWHSLTVIRRRKELYVNIDDSRFTKSANFDYTPRESCMPEKQLAYIGGYPFVDSLDVSRSKVNYAGCIQQMHMHGQKIELRQEMMGLYTRVSGNLWTGCRVKERQPQGVSLDKLFPPSTPALRYRQEMLETRLTTKLSQSTVGWITGGIVVGCIVLILTLALGIHYLRRRYSGKFVTSNMRTNIYGAADDIGERSAYSSLKTSHHHHQRRGTIV